MRSVDRDAFSKAKDDFIMSVVRSGAAGEAATKVAVTLAVMFANRAAFEGRGELTAWPSMRLLAEETGLFRSRIARALKTLESAGHLLVDRPEKRGATHHNRYTLVTAIGCTRADNPDSSIGRTNVANSIVRTDADNDTPQLAATVRTILAAPVGPNSLEEPLEGGRALGRASAAPMQDAVSIICDGQINDADGGDLGGLEAHPAAHAEIGRANFHGLSAEESWAEVERWLCTYMGSVEEDAAVCATAFASTFDPEGRSEHDWENLVRSLVAMLKGGTRGGLERRLDRTLEVAAAFLVAIYGNRSRLQSDLRLLARDVMQAFPSDMQAPHSMGARYVG